MGILAVGATTMGWVCNTPEFNALMAKVAAVGCLISNALCAVGCIPLMECTMVKQFLR
jgi:hypothetical protein